MADETFQGSQWPREKQTLGTGEGESPLGAPSSLKIDLRTMASDEKSLKEMGGTEPRPYIPPPLISDKQAEMPKFDSTFGQMLEKNVINPPSVPSTPMPPPAIPADLTKIKSKKKKGSFGLVIVLVLVVGVAALGYFVIYPNFIKKPVAPAFPVCGNSACENGEDTSSCPADCQTPPPPTNPVCGNGACESGEDFQNCPTDCQALPPPPVDPTTHNSFFKTPADSTQDITIQTLAGTVLKQTISFETSGTPILKEIVLKTGAGESISFTDFRQAVFPNALLDLFNPDATFFVYTNSKGTWPGIVLQLKAEANTANTFSDINKKITDNSSEVSNLFLADPGQPQTWKNGQISGVSNYYLNFTNPGFTINFGWLNDKLLISASYDGFKEALRHLQ